MKKKLIAAIVLAAAMGLGGCSGSGRTSGTGTTEAVETTQAETAQATTEETEKDTALLRMIKRNSWKQSIRLWPRMYRI